jgi:hypothetical protein
VRLSGAAAGTARTDDPRGGPGATFHRAVASGHFAGRRRAVDRVVWNEPGGGSAREFAKPNVDRTAVDHPSAGWVGTPGIFGRETGIRFSTVTLSL